MVIRSKKHGDRCGRMLVEDVGVVGALSILAAWGGGTGLIDRLEGRIIVVCTRALCVVGGRLPSSWKVIIGVAARLAIFAGGGRW